MISVWQGLKGRLRTAQKEREIALSPFHRRFHGRLPARMVNDKIYINDDYQYIFFRIPKNANSFVIANLSLMQNGVRLSLAEVDRLKTHQPGIHQLAWKEAEETFVMPKCIKGEKRPETDTKRIASGAQ
jgi:hypothetical protein